MANWHPEWLSYVPFVLLKDHLQSSSTSEQHVTVVCLKLSFIEAENAPTSTNPESLQAASNQRLEPLITLLMNYGSIIVNLTGSKLTVVFPYTESNRVDILHRALHCCLLVVESISAVKVGVSAGRVSYQSLGDASVGLKSVIYGDVCDESHTAHDLAVSGEVLVYKHILQGLEDVISIAKSEEVSQIVSVERSSVPSPFTPSKETPTDVLTALSAFVHPVVRKRIDASQGDYLNEYRHVTLLHLQLTVFNLNDHEGLAAYFKAVLSLINHYDGSLGAVELHKNDSHYEVVFGAPVAHENDVERALRCAIDITRLTPYQVVVTIREANTYYGQIGSTLRRVYTSIDRTAPPVLLGTNGQIIVTESVRRKMRGRFIFAPISLQEGQQTEYFSLQSERVAHGRRSYEPQYHLRMIGRDTELAIANEKLEEVMVSRGKIIGITGEAGIGKSRLIAEIAKNASVAGLEVYNGACQSYATQTSYLVWRDVLRGLFGLQASSTEEEQLNYLAQKLDDIDPNLRQRMPLLSSPLNFPIRENELTASLEPELRFDLLASLLLTCLKYWSNQNPLLLILEDCHWIDPVSQQLLDFMGRNISDLPIMLLVVYRLLPSEINPLENLVQSSYVTEINLKEFSITDVNRLIRLKVDQLFGSDTALPPLVAERIILRSQGNPFYVEELMNYIHDLQINIDDQKRLEAIELPASLHDLVVSRMDRLTEDEKSILKVASVIGRAFKANWLWGAYAEAELASPLIIKENLDRLNEVELTLLYQPEPELEYLFKHILTQEVAYDSIPRVTRQRLHEKIALYIEQVFSNSTASVTDLLAYHYGRSTNSEKQRLYFRLAADAARDAYANRSAIAYYQQLVSLVSDAEKADVLLQLANAWTILGEWSQAEVAFEQVISQTMDDPLLQAKAKNAYGYLLELKGEQNKALEQLQEAQATFEQIGDLPGILKSLEYLTFVSLRHSDYDRALADSEKQLQLATDLNDIRSQVEANMNIAWVYADRGDLDRAQTYTTSGSEIATQNNYKRGIIHSFSDSAGLFAGMGQYLQAMENLSLALDTAMEIGFLHTAAGITMNMGTVYRDYGDFERSLICYIKGLELYLILGDRVNIVNALGNIAIVQIKIHTYGDTNELLTKAIQTSRELNIPSILCEQLYYQALLNFLQNQDLDAALQFVNEALKLVIDLGDVEYHLNGILLDMQLRVHRGHLQSIDAIAQLSEMLNQWEDESQQAAILYTIWELDNNQTDIIRLASEIYQQLYKETGTFEYADRYYNLTNQRLPPPPKLPALPQVIIQNPIPLAILLQRFDNLK